MMGRRKARGLARTLATIGVFAVLIVTAASLGDTDNSTSGCINAHPEILDVQPGPGTVRIEWTPMTLTSVTGYLVEYRSHCDNQCHRTRVGSVNTTTIEGLHFYSNYTLRMTVVCNTTPSVAFSPPETFNITSQKVMVAPENVSVETLNISTKVVRWQALAPCDWSGEPEGYMVVVTDLTTSSEVRQTVSWRHQTVHLVLHRGRSYNISILAVNSEGEGPSSTTITFTVQGPGGVETTAGIGVVVAVAMMILILLILAAFVTVLVCVKCKTIRCCKSDPLYDDVKVELKGVQGQFEDVKLEPNPAYGEVTLSEAQTEPQPFVALKGVVENPAYQAVDPQPYEYVVGVTSSDATAEEDPAYQSVDQTVPQTEEPV